MYEGKNPSLICIFRSYLHLMDLCRVTGKKEIELLGWVLKLLKSFLASLDVLNVYLRQITKNYLTFLHMHMQMCVSISFEFK